MLCVCIEMLDRETRSYFILLGWNIVVRDVTYLYRVGKTFHEMSRICIEMH